MKDLNNTDLFDPRSTVMDSDFARTVTPSTDADFAFAFNDSNFSDRLLRIEIMGDTPESRPDSEACTSIADWARHRKRRREDFKKDNSTYPLSISPSISLSIRHGVDVLGFRLVCLARKAQELKNFFNFWCLLLRNGNDVWRY